MLFICFCPENLTERLLSHGPFDQVHLSGRPDQKVYGALWTDLCSFTPAYLQVQSGLVKIKKGKGLHPFLIWWTRSEGP